MCGKSFEDITANELNSVHLDHCTGVIKGSISTCTSAQQMEPSNYRMAKPADAVIEWAKCESVCGGCHDMGMGPGKGPGGTVKGKKKGPKSRVV